jgi:hypothetical protein
LFPVDPLVRRRLVLAVTVVSAGSRLTFALRLRRYSTLRLSIADTGDKRVQLAKAKSAKHDRKRLESFIVRNTWPLWIIMMIKTVD